MLCLCGRPAAHEPSGEERAPSGDFSTVGMEDLDEALDELAASRPADCAATLPAPKSAA